MFVRNRTTFSPQLAKAYFARDRGELCVSIEAVFDILPDGTLNHAGAVARRVHDPPDIGGRVQWRGTSVTAFATVDAPSRAPFARTVRLRVVDRVIDLVVFGNRYWERRSGQWMQSAPERFERLGLSWDRAFGGVVDWPPHRTWDGLPHPGGTFSFALNPMGRGLCVDPSPVPIDGTPLPNVEHSRALICSPTDLPMPQGFAPCPELFGLRMAAARSELPTDSASFETALASWAPLRMIHHAPGALIFEESLSAGARLAISGPGAEPIRTQVPSCPARARIRSASRTRDLHPQVRSVHLDADRRQLRVTWGHTHAYHPRRAPQWIDVEQTR